MRGRDNSANKGKQQEEREQQAARTGTTGTAERRNRENRGNGAYKGNNRGLWKRRNSENDRDRGSEGTGGTEEQGNEDRGSEGTTGIARSGKGRGGGRELSKRSKANTSGGWALDAYGDLEKGGPAVLPLPCVAISGGNGTNGGAPARGGTEQKLWQIALAGAGQAARTVRSGVIGGHVLGPDSMR
jgi:hypothetical protein